VVHGSLYLATKTEGGLNDRARKVASWLWPVQVLLTIFSLIATVYAVPHILDSYTRWPIGYLVPVVVIGSLMYMYFAHSRRQEKGAFLASCAYIIAMLVGAVFALYPNVLPASTGSQYNLTIYNSAAGAHGLGVGFVWWSIAMVLAAAYFIFIYRMFRGKVRLEEGGGHGY
jgi:cytochrome d ubiquinol oxidase subunit II